MKKMDRRHFLKTSGKMTLVGAAGLCIDPILSGILVGPSKMALASNPQAGFNVYNGVNPNAKDIVAHTFKDCLTKKWVPGICYKTSKPMVAVAAGTVTDTFDLASGSSIPFLDLEKEQNQEKGFLVRITHGNNCGSFYLHLRQPEVKFGQEIKRGQIIGYPDERWNMPRLALYSLGAEDMADPNNYGIDHGFMTYWDGAANLEIGMDEQNKRFETQQKLLYKIADMVEGPEKYTLLKKSHKGVVQYRWSMIEKFRCVEYKYRNEPETFPSLTKEQFKEMRKEFYRNQPIILTLPFKKG
jgi:hypothetical protein